jgi:hypothetical protein
MCARIAINLIHAPLIGKHVGSMVQDFYEFVINKLYQQFILLSSCISFVDAQHFKVKKGNRVWLPLVVRSHVRMI